MNDNPVLLLVHNCIELTKRCVESIKNQDIPTYLLVIDNASTDSTFIWLQENHIHTVRNETNEGVSAGWNWGFDTLFGAGYDWILSPNNDTILAPNAYRRLLEYNVPFVTGISTDDMSQINPAAIHEDHDLVEGPDFSLFLLRRAAWEKIGKFDTEMLLYAGDNDFHIRAHRAGVRLLRGNVPFYHERSSTLRSANPKERRLIEMQADADRLVFFEKYGFHTWSPEYAAQFTPLNFGVDSK
jgi:GT2 family glycosyltransferase